MQQEAAVIADAAVEHEKTRAAAEPSSSREWLWTWTGRFFGYREGDELWTSDGVHVGRFGGREVYGPGGRYLGELMLGRLITHRLRGREFADSRFAHPAQPDRERSAGQADIDAYQLLAGYDDFPLARGPASKPANKGL